MSLIQSPVRYSVVLLVSYSKILDSLPQWHRTSIKQRSCFHTHVIGIHVTKKKHSSGIIAVRQSHGQLPTKNPVLSLEPQQ